MGKKKKERKMGDEETQSEESVKRKEKIGC